MRIETKEVGNALDRECWQRLASTDEVIKVTEFAVGVLATREKGVGSANILISFNDGDYSFMLPDDLDSIKRFIESLLVAVTQLPTALVLAETGILPDLIDGKCVVVPMEQEGRN